MKETSTFDSNITAGALLYTEFSLVGEHLNSNFSNFLDSELENNSRIGIPSYSARKRIIPEMKKRYNVVPIEFWEHFNQWNENTQRLALFFTCLKTYPLIFDLHYEVARKKNASGSTLGAYDVQMRLDELASEDAKVATWSIKTLEKINSQYRKLLKQAGLYNSDTELLKKPSNIDTSFWMFLEMNNENWFKEACFL